jgi:hypothetical protein
MQRQSTVTATATIAIIVNEGCEEGRIEEKSEGRMEGM